MKACPSCHATQRDAFNYPCVVTTLGDPHPWHDDGPMTLQAIAARRQAFARRQASEGAELHAETVEAITRALEGGQSVSQVAEVLGISRQRVYQLLDKASHMV